MATKKKQPAKGTEELKGRITTTAKRTTSKKTTSKNQGLKQKKDRTSHQAEVKQKIYKPRSGTKQVTTGGGRTVDWPKDIVKPARPVGRRISRNGNVYYEYRQNRSDTEGEIYGGMSVLDKKTLKVQDQYGIIYHGGELVTPEDKRSKTKLSESKLLEIVKSYERKIHKRPIENLLYFDECGNIISHCVGSSGSVYIDKEAENACVVNTHNHPYNNLKPAPQSDADVMNFLMYGSKIARVCSYGVTYQYKKGPNYNPSKLSRSEISALRSQLKKEFLKTQKELFKRVGKYLGIEAIVKTSGGKVHVFFKNVNNLPLKTYSRAVSLAYQMYSNRLGVEMISVHRAFTDKLKSMGVDIIFTVGEL